MLGCAEDASLSKSLDVADSDLSNRVSIPVYQYRYRYDIV